MFKPLCYLPGDTTEEKGSVESRIGLEEESHNLVSEGKSRRHLFKSRNVRKRSFRIIDHHLYSFLTWFESPLPILKSGDEIIPAS